MRDFVARSFRGTGWRSLVAFPRLDISLAFRTSHSCADTRDPKPRICTPDRFPQTDLHLVVYCFQNGNLRNLPRTYAIPFPFGFHFPRFPFAHLRGVAEMVRPPHWLWLSHWVLTSHIGEHGTMQRVGPSITTKPWCIHSCSLLKSDFRHHTEHHKTTPEKLAKTRFPFCCISVRDPS